MRLGITSDIHGVAGALRAVLGDGERLGVEVEFDVQSVVDALHRRRHPNREFTSSVLVRGTFFEAD